MTTVAPSPYNIAGPMVSQPFTSERALAVRRPSSVSSRTSGTRRHRTHRSHHGGSNYMPQNEFPNFAHTGDVEIIVAIDGQEKRYMLHRLILAQCSGFFEASTSEQWSRAQAQAQIQSSEHVLDSGLSTISESSEGSTVGRNRSVSRLPPSQRPMWRYELDIGNDGSDNSDDEVPMLVQKPYTPSIFSAEPSPRPPPVRNKPPSQPNGFFRSMAAMQSAIHLPHSSTSAPQNQPPESEIIRDYDNLFRIFYNYPPSLDAVNITEAYIQCKTLLTLADQYDALEVVGPRIDHHLLQFQSRLWKQIAKYPPSYLKLGYLARSKSIFAEALIHVVGQWPAGAAQLRSVPDAVLDLIEDKVADLDDLKARIEGRLFRLSLTSPRSGERVNPHTSYQDWLVVSLFRHWLAENLTPSPPPPPKSIPSPNTQHPHHGYGQGPRSHQPPPHHHQQQPPLPSPSALAASQASACGRPFRLLGSSSLSAYLSHDEIKKFLKTARPEDYSRDGLRRFERRMDELKGLAREVVRPLMKNYLELEVAGPGAGRLEGGNGSLGYLTCTKVGEGEYPW